MSDVVIKAEGLGKKYVIGHQAESGGYVALRDVLTHNVRNMWHKTKDLFRGDVPVQGDSREDIWALRDINFEIRQGEVVGIIGRNGAGKSTLLKILSRITEPTEGRVFVKGRMASLLEVGTGFHPELTGRENIFLNGSILGMTRAEIKSKFDEIVTFAEVEKFLDVPVKRYSSGMYVRLAFAVAAHLEPEILVVDEVLAVGDAEFQLKCLGKMQEVSTGGRTVLFVSHNMAAVRRLCARGIYLVNGRVEFEGRVDKVIDKYLAGVGAQQALFQPQSRNGFALHDIRVCESGSYVPKSSVVFGADYELHFRISIPQDSFRVNPVVRVYNSSGTLVSSICAPEEGVNGAPDGTSDWIVRLSSLQLMPGPYSLTFQLYGSEPDPCLEVLDALRFIIEPALIDCAAKAYSADHGIVRIASEVSVRAETVA